MRYAFYAVAFMAAAINADAADLIIHGGPIYTADDDRPMAEAVAIDDGAFVHVGDKAGAMALREAHTQIIDLAGAALFPGFTDAHAHLHGIGLRELTLNLEGTDSIADLRKRLALHVAAAEPGDPVVGRGWIETHWPEGRFPTRHDLDDVAPDNPVFLVRADGHAAVINSAAMRQSGITDETMAPFGGEILKDEDGRPTGMLIDAAMGLAVKVSAGTEQLDRAGVYERADDVYTAYGWTGIHNMSVLPDDVPVIERLSDEGRVSLRVYNSIDQQGARELMGAGSRRSDNGKIITRAVKLYMDGALGSRGAALLEPYLDAETTGLLMMREDDTVNFLEDALKAGIQVNTHAIGDRANRLVLDWYEKAFASVPKSERKIAEPRWRIEHAQIVHPDDLKRFPEMGVIASMQPSHAIGDLHFAPDRLGEERLKGAYAWNSLIGKGAIIAAGSDAPVERGDPLIEFYAAVARMDLSGYSGKGWHKEEAVARDTALKMFTLWPAIASFQDDELGTISVGKRADLTAFSADLMRIDVAEIPKARAILTVIDGKIAHRAFDN